MKTLVRSSFVLSAAAAAALAAVPASALEIQAYFDSSITNDANSAAIQNSINSVISVYESTFADPITVKIYFQKGGGLGSSSWTYYWNDASWATNAMGSDATTANDATAVSHLGTNVFGSVAVTSANGRALGLGTNGFYQAGGHNDLDGAVSLNTDICFFDHNSPVAGKYDLYGVAAHEIDEVLGTPSGVGDWLAFAPDLYRYDENHNRTFDADTNHHAYFSIDAATNIVEYHHYQRTGGDWGDWVVHDPSMAQDYALRSGQSVAPGDAEFTLLDVIGYDYAPVPEPGTIVILGIAGLAALRRRRKA